MISLTLFWINVNPTHAREGELKASKTTFIRKQKSKKKYNWRWKMIRIKMINIY